MKFLHGVVLTGQVLHPFTDEAVVTCYGPGETWNSIFGHISASFEECRAECVGIYLSAIPEVSAITGILPRACHFRSTY